MKGCSNCNEEQGFEEDSLRKNTRKEKKRREHELALKLQKRKSRKKYDTSGECSCTHMQSLRRWR